MVKDCYEYTTSMSVYLHGHVSLYQKQIVRPCVCVINVFTQSYMLLLGQFCILKISLVYMYRGRVTLFKLYARVIVLLRCQISFILSTTVSFHSHYCIYTSISIAALSFTGRMKFIPRWTSLALSPRTGTKNTNDVMNVF